MTDSSGLGPAQPTPDRLARNADAWLLAGLAILLGAIFFDMAIEYWLPGTNGQAPVVLAAAAMLYWRQRPLFDWRTDARERGIGWALVTLALLATAVGRSVAFLQLEGVAIALVAAGVTLLWGGVKALRKLWTVNLLMLVAIPLPRSMADALLVPLKADVSAAVVLVLAHLGYPVALNGVIISIGFYQLQIADACSGLWSLVSLVSIGLIYQFFVGSSRREVSVIFLALIPFIAITTNFLRVMALVLTVGTFGAYAEQKLHDTAAYLEIVLSLVLFSAAHGLLERVMGSRPEPVR